MPLLGGWSGGGAVPALLFPAMRSGNCSVFLAEDSKKEQQIYIKTYKHFLCLGIKINEPLPRSNIHSYLIKHRKIMYYE